VCSSSMKRMMFFARLISSITALIAPRTGRGISYRQP
jgi:hypothetical protein